MESKELISNILKLVFVLFLAFVIYELIRKLAGGSWGFEELVISLLIANVGYSFYLKGSINRVESKLSEHIGWHRGKDSK